ncbi:MAG: GNAT family N-acetyltransferase, partial [Anaerolineae bacterium]|nr:GNAT family N-acetyltransferase [Anaerolineae bacterium]
ETGWIDKEKNEIMDLLITRGAISSVAEVNGAAECLVLRTPGTIRYLDADLPFAGVTGVTTSRIARKQGFASRLTAQVIAEGVAEGAAVFGLGMFEQGFYNQLGFGTGAYEHWISFDPARLRVDVRARVPQRITADDWEKVHAARLVRLRGHGSCNLTPPELTQTDMRFADKGFGLGYFDDAGQITHHLWCNCRDVSHGPYWVEWMSYQDYGQLLELMALLKNLGDQVHLIEMQEPAGIQLQDLIEQPFKQQHITEKSRFEAKSKAIAHWQVRICDLPACLDKTHLNGTPLRFNLTLSDPVARLLPDAPCGAASWRGVSGEYVVVLGPESSAKSGRDESLPTLKASVNAFSRLWLGALPATGLVVTDDLAGPPELLNQLDDLLRLPRPSYAWEF